LGLKTNYLDAPVIRPNGAPILRPIGARASAPKGHNVIAQGNALGKRPDKTQALKGRHVPRTPQRQIHFASTKHHRHPSSISPQTA
jgi:hypothetical protein